MLIRIGTRNSKLALWQTEAMAALLNKKGIETKIIPMETKGDKIQNVSISKIGSKGVFTEELEGQLHSGAIDIAVHSAKDLQSDLGEQLEIIAFSEREKPNDVLVSSRSTLRLEENSSFTVGTSSTRRVATLKRHFPYIRIIDMRGNLQTRLSKMEAGQCDAMILAYAGMHRMGYDHFIAQTLDADQFVPAVGQGTIAIEASKKLDPEKKKVIRSAINHPATEVCLTAERAYLKKLEGGCSIPVFGKAELDGQNIHMIAGIISLDGKKEIRKEQKSESMDKPEELGEQLASEVLENGGGEILAEIKKSI